MPQVYPHYRSHQHRHSDPLSDLLPADSKNWSETRQFLMDVVEVLLTYVKDQYDRESKVLEFHHPAEMQQLLDFAIHDEPKNLGDLLQVASNSIRWLTRMLFSKNTLSFTIFSWCNPFSWYCSYNLPTRKTHYPPKTSLDNQ